MFAVIKSFRRKQTGFAAILALIFLSVFTAMAVAMVSMTSTSRQISRNHHRANQALCAAQSGIETAKYIFAGTPTISTGDNTVSSEQADETWSSFCSYLTANTPGGVAVSAVQNFTDGSGSGSEIFIPSTSTGLSGGSYAVRFRRYTSQPLVIVVSSTGTSGEFNRIVNLNFQIKKQNDVLKFAIASRGRMMVTGDTAIYGPIASSWNKPQWHAPIETTSDTSIYGSINTVITKSQFAANNMQMETLDANGNPVFDEQGNRVYSPQDKCQGYHEGINYGQTFSNMPGMSIDDYDTSAYEAMTSTLNGGGGDIASCPSNQRVIEYFPHQPGNYSSPKDGASWPKRYTRHVYQNQTFTNVRLPQGRNALFRNCTFNGILFVDTRQSYTDSASYVNNVRFDNCTFNGVIITDTPSTSTGSSWWMRNVLYFTGGATFQNTSPVQDATILAPNFNVNLGNALELEENPSVLTGAVVGGIVDVRGNAQINGTIISMYDTSVYQNGYVTNIGFAEDGGNEGGLPEDVGTIEITCSPENMLPSGITTPIVIEPVGSSWREEY